MEKAVQYIGVDAEVLCEGHEHQGFNGLDEVFHMSVDQLFEYLFTDHQFYRDFVEARKTYGKICIQATLATEI